MASKTPTGKGRPEPKTKAGHNGRYPDQPAKSSYKPNDPARAKTVRV